MKPKLKAVNKPLHHSIRHVLDKPGSPATVSLCRLERKGPRDAEDTVGSNELISVLGQLPRLLWISTCRSATAHAEDIAF